ncbi:VanZ family protein [Faecalibacillus intestinalis]|uniref:VanZ family protein n=1 Tax=Faecalibacillus intestinalis TaxID=1982626 RepID=UPI00352089EC
MKKNKYLILTILWMIFIFVMSHTPGNDSSKQSNFIVNIIVQILPITRNTLSFIVRKCAHMTEYAILAFLIYKTIVHIEKPLIKSLIFTFLYACTDEFHQLFIAGRAGQIRDVCIDSTGALIMLLIIYFILKRKDKKIGS